MTHISERVADRLIDDGWTMGAETAEGQTFRRTVPTGGAFGRTAQFVTICPAGRWLEQTDGWGQVLQCVDLRDHTDPGTAIAAVLDPDPHLIRIPNTKP